jgi:general secretion pathway protein D
MGFPAVGGAAAPMGATTPGVSPGAGVTGDLTGSYMGYGAMPAMGRYPRVVPNPFDNTLLIQATPQEYQSILKLLREIDVSPRQVLIEAKIYEVALTGAFASGVSVAFQKLSGANKQFTGTLADGLTVLSAGMVVGRSRELLAFLSLQESSTNAKVISAPSVIATDSIGASINVGTEVPTLTAQAVTGLQSAGSSLFANTIQNRNSGVTLNVIARVNPNGIVTLQINQEVSAPQAPAATSAIQSPSFSKRNVQTQVTVQDGDTIAIGGIIHEDDTQSSVGIPFLHRIPVLGYAFGSKSISKTRTELIVFLTPRVIYDTNQITEASEELKARLNRLKKIVQE